MQLDELINSVLLERTAPKYAFKAVIVMGPPGSGKNTIIDRHLYSPHFKLDDFDDVMQRMKVLRDENVEYKHSYQIATQRRNLWQKNWLGIVINTTGRRANNVIDLKKLLEEVGYDVFGIFVKAPYDVAMQRVKQRPAVSQKIADRNRIVDPDYFDVAYVDSIKNLKTYKQIFNPANFSVVVNDPDNEYYEASLSNLDRNIKRFLRTPIQNPVGKEKLSNV